MNWFKSQDPLLEILKDQNERLKNQTTWLERRVEALTAQILQMKRDGYNYTAPPQMPEKTDTLDERVMAAIRSRVREGSREEVELIEYASGLLIMGGEIEDVVDHILAGAQVE